MCANDFKYIAWLASGILCAAAPAWLVTLVLAFIFPLEIYFKALPGWFITVFVFVTASTIEQKVVHKTVEV